MPEVEGFLKFCFLFCFVHQLQALLSRGTDITDSCSKTILFLQAPVDTKSTNNEVLNGNIFLFVCQ